MLSVILIGSTFTLNAQNRKVAITIDDLPATPADANKYQHITDKLVKTLTEKESKAICFVNERDYISLLAFIASERKLSTMNLKSYEH